MKLIILFFALTVNCVLLAQINSPISHWPLDGNVNDIAGANQGQKIGGSYENDRFGNGNKCISLDGSSYILVPSNVLSGLSEISISMWFNTNTLSNSYQARIFRDRPTDIVLGFYNGNFYFDLTTSSGTKSISIPIAEFEIETWHHIVATYNGTLMKLYINNDLKASNAHNGITSDNPGDAAIGCNPYEQGYGQFFNGLIDDVRLYNIALNDNEVQELYTGLPVFSGNWVEGTNGIYYTNGSVSINTNVSPSDYVLAVNGKAIMEEVKVQLHTNWPDYVFKKNYDLRTLDEVEKHIVEIGYLPEIPSKAEVTENGINLGEMDAKLLQKIEELTLYLIEQNKELKAQKEEIEKLKQQLNKD